MSTPVRRSSVLAAACLGFGLLIGCSASETTNTVAPADGAGGSAMGGKAGTAGGGASNAGGRTGTGLGGATSCSSTGTGGAPPVAGATSVCEQCGVCVAFARCTNRSGATCSCNGQRYYCN